MLKYHLNSEIDAASRNSGFIDKSVNWIVKHFQVENGTKIADFGCGPGLYANRLASRGANVTGIDFSRNSLDYARKTAETKGLPVNFENCNYLDFESEDRFRLVMMIMCDFCALSPEQRKLMLKKFYSLLIPGGAALLDVYSLKYFNEIRETAYYEENQLNGFWSPEKYYGFVNTFKYDCEKLALDKYTIVEASRTRTVYNWQQCFTPESLKKEFTDCGFTVESLHSDVAGIPFTPETKEFAIVARK